MPTFVELQKRLKRTAKESQIRLGTDEVLIADARAAMRPGDFVDEKIRAAQLSDATRQAAELALRFPSGWESGRRIRA